MAELDFPNSPAPDEIFNRWRWNGLTWQLNDMDGGMAVPSGGLTGQLLAKDSSADGDTEWVDPAVYSMAGPTIDTEEEYRVIMFSDGRTRAVPIGAENPDLPLSFTRTVRVSSVKLVWTAGAGAVSYRIYRDGVLLGATSDLTYRDSNVTVGAEYFYTIQSVNIYEMRSGSSFPLAAYIDPALNVTPTVEIRTFPPTAIALGNQAIVRVNGLDVDGQTIAMALNTSVGSVSPTVDPSVWILTPA